MTAGKMIAMQMADGANVGVYHAEPAGARRGGVVLIQEIFGITDHIKECCDSHAAEGYEVLAPALFDREAPGLQAGYSPEELQKAFAIARQLHPFDLSVEDSRVCIDALKSKGKVFILGYCYGGSVTWAAACRCEGLAAASGFYGSMVPAMADEMPKCPTILHFGKEDAGIPLEGVEKVRAAHPEVPIYLYDAGHGFNSNRPTHYNEAAAKLAFQRTLDLFKANGG